jgi:hypothetical protein
VAVFAFGFLLAEPDPCRRGGPGAAGLLIGALVVGLIAYFGAQRVSARQWIHVAAFIFAALTSAAAVYGIALSRWLEACAN